ncbi:ORC-CDC6 family AAA ATPase [Gimibacter soli]|uniref:Uncharacterized protein n=1 Tax=Gimibacter soli TaxID=3024400 RepID=A0AAE9XMG4_9PROT|nr:hypothetical protein [Gimibacter soli]WCL53494.1 hypothetical protein PH603_13195 [Gimibacter soli]
MMTANLQKISDLFGSYKAEWLNDSIFELYKEPAYYPELTTFRPCALIGGRGTGKTTVLRTLSYQGQLELIRRKERELPDASLWRQMLEQRHIGLYYRVNIPRVTAFRGGGVDQETWSRLFKHYFALTFAQKAFAFLQAAENNLAQRLISNESLGKISRVLCIESCNGVDDVLLGVESALLKIEMYVNNIGIDDCPRLSATGALDFIFTELVNNKFFVGKTFFLIIDEYENFLEFQQEIVNTYIKHATTSYTFKIGARHLGWSNKGTESRDQFLHHPSDYVLINIAEAMAGDKFAEFAEKVCNARLEAAGESEEVLLVRDLFPGLSSDEEASLLGLGPLAAELRAEVRSLKNKDLCLIEDSLSDLDLYVVSLWAEGERRDFIEVYSEISEDRTTWDNRLREYRYSALFNIKRGKSGIKKYYSGWNVYLKLCGDNIRYLMELVEKAIRLHAEAGCNLANPIPADRQTDAAISVGKKNLGELSGLTSFGAQLTKLVLALGRIFGLLASDTAGHSIEVNQFRLSTRSAGRFSSIDDWLLNADSKASQILRASVMHLALLTFPGNKPKGEGDLKDETYQLHPIFAPFFNYSHRRRRNLMLNEAEIVDLIEAPAKTIRSIVERQNRGFVEELPGQLKLFEEFFND